MINESLTCPGCGSHVDRTDRFCRQCGLCLEKTPEIKQQRYVTILFSDLSGYTSMSEDLDTEELSEIMGRIFNHASKTISDLSGKVEKFIGDAIVAIFGMETTREDDVIRAIRAAIEIHSFVKDMDVTRITDRPLRMHTGINAGEILVTPGKEGALGRPINLASRISVLAPAGDILIGDTIYPEANRFFRLEPFSNTHLKGIHRIVTTYRVVAPRQLPLPVHGENSFVSPLIGRKEQLSTLKRHLNDLYHKKGSTMHVSGQAGVGKSRLIEEFRSIVPRDINWIDAVCLDYAGNIPYFPIKGIVGSIIEKTTLPTIKEKFSSRLDNFIRGVADKTGLGPNEWKMQVFGTVAELIRQASGILPMVICIENLHWADPSSLDLIRYLDSSLDCPCLFVLSSREALNMPGEKIRLDDLSREQSLCMVKNMTNIKGLSEKEMNHLFCLSAGNPFFLEEIVNFGITSKTGLSSLHGFPNTIKGMVSAGLDHLDQDSKEVLQRACVIGSSFSPGLIDALCPDMELNSALFDLIDAGYLAMKKDDRICFRHDLVREVTYDGMLKGVRQGLHLKIGLEMETMYTDNIQPWAEVLAHHFVLSKDRKRAISYSMMAARRCRDSGSWVEAANLYIMAQRCIDETGTGTGTGDQLTKILEGIWECTRIFRPDMAIDALERLGAYYNEQAMKKERDFVQIRLINLYSQKGTFDKALDTFNKIDGDTKMTKALSECAVAYTYTFLGRQDTAIEHLERSRPVLATGQRFFLAVNTITTLAAYVWKGAIREALYWYSRTKKLSKGHLDLELMADIWLGYIDFLSGNFTSGTKTFLRILDAQERLGSTAGGLSYIHTQSSLYFSAVYMGNLEQASHDLERFVHLDRTLCVNGAKALRDLYDAWICLEKGLSTKAIDLLEGALPSLKKGAANRVPYAINALCAAHLDTGEISCAQDLAARGIAWNERFGNQDQLIWSYRSAAKACIMKNDLEQAKPLLVRASMLSKKCMMKPHMAWNHSVWALYWKKQGDKEKADACTGRSQRMWLEMECPYQAEKIP